MKPEKDRPGWAVTVTLVAAIGFIILALVLLSGCSSSKPLESTEREITRFAFYVPVPSPELEGISWAELLEQFQIRTLSAEAVKADGSLYIQALTHDFLIVVDELWHAFKQREASNKTRKGVLEAQAKAEAELERLNAQ